MSINIALDEIKDLVCELENELDIAKKNIGYAERALVKIKTKIVVIHLMDDLKQKED
jgi:hypothetical protein